MGRVRRAGVLLAASVVLLWAIYVGNVLSGVVHKELRIDRPQSPASYSAGDPSYPPGPKKVVQGTGGPDILHGLSGGGEIVGGSGADEVYGGSGPDVMLGGLGDDFVEAKDSMKDSVGCGSGHDIVSVDEKDRVAPDCETVYRA